MKDKIDRISKRLLLTGAHKPKDIISWYLRGTLYLTALKADSPRIEKTGAERGNLPRASQFIRTHLDKVFDTVEY